MFVTSENWIIKCDRMLQCWNTYSQITAVFPTRAPVCVILFKQTLTAKITYKYSLNLIIWLAFSLRKVKDIIWHFPQSETGKLILRQRFVTPRKCIISGCHRSGMCNATGISLNCTARARPRMSDDWHTTKDKAEQSWTARSRSVDKI